MAHITLAFSAKRGRAEVIRWLSCLGALGCLGLIVRVAVNKQPLVLSF